MTYYSEELKDAAVDAYITDEDTTEEEIALQYGISQTTLSRHLAERGYKVLSSYKTANERQMLAYLRGKGVVSLAGLQRLIP